MSITDELRKWAEDNTLRDRELTTYPPQHVVHGVLETLLHIADRIDAEHERITHNLTDALHKQEDATRELDEKSVLLPVDANGVPFHIGDKVDSDHYEDGTIIGVHYFRAPNGVVYEEIAVQPNGWDVATWRDPEEYAHHHAPTV